jgi:hypothetical protein
VPVGLRATSPCGSVYHPGVKRPIGYVLMIVLAVVGSSGVLVIAVAVYGVNYLIMGDVISELAISATPTTTPIVFAGGRRVQLTLHASKLAEGDVCKRLAVDVDLLHGGNRFQGYSGHGWTFHKASERNRTNSTMTLDTLELPPGGFDQIRTSYRFEPAGCGGSVDGLVLQFRKPRL